MSNSLTRETAPRESQELTHARPALIAQHFLHRRATLSQAGYVKTTHLLQELLGHRTGYRFTMYATGPESLEALRGLHLAAQNRAVDMTYNSCERLHHITPGARAPGLLANYHDHLTGYAQDLLKILDATVPLNGRELSLAATIAHLWQQARPADETDTRRIILTASELLGPKRAEEIERTLARMRLSRLLHLHT